MSLTDSQQQAVSAHGNVLVAAGAGTGKTRALVERCLVCLLQEHASIDEILVVTFTEAAAAEMRQRIRGRLEEEKRAHPTEIRWSEQLALFETAQIGTLHSFCYQLVRQHFYELGLDPQLTVMAEEEAALLANETLDELFQRHYSGRDPTAEAVQRLIQVQGRGWDKPIRLLLLRLHHYAQTLPDPGLWLANQLSMFAAPEAATWQAWLAEALEQFNKSWLPRLEVVSGSNEVAAQCVAALRRLNSASLAKSKSEALTDIVEASKSCKRGKKGSWVDPYKAFFSGAEFLASLLSSASGLDPLKQDWAWVREPMSTLVELAREFSEKFTQAKRELGVLDFHDLEQYSLRLLWDSSREAPSSIARHWRARLRFVFVDEYQDINAAQDSIIQALSREDEPNRFLVGDVKQSIYGFRLANPQIFQGYAERWSAGNGRVIPLVENFRARERLLNFINSVFGMLMTRQLGGVDYPGAALAFAVPEQRRELSAVACPEPAVELHLLLKSVAAGSEDAEGGAEALTEIAELLEAEKEARLVGWRLRELRRAKYPVWDEQQKQFRPADWGDMAILLRAPANKSESYAKEFARLGLPLHVERAGFYRSLEVLDLLNLLQLVDNPLQDLPALAVLHSPLVGLSATDLAEIRLASSSARFWTALSFWHRNGAAPTEKGAGSGTDRGENGGEAAVQDNCDAHRKVGRFLERFGRWRRLARQVSLSRCLETILEETHYCSWLITQSNGAQRHANVQRLLTLAQQFDQFQRQGLFRFLRFIEAQQEAKAEPEVPEVSPENSVRLMSVHQSKGLEFPIVVLADAGKGFNLSDVRAEVILDEKYGLAPLVKPPHSGQRYPSLAYWLASERRLQELLGEELRLLYVAMTRAKDRLILTGSIAENRLLKTWAEKVQDISEARVAARSYTDWLGLWFAQTQGPVLTEKPEGQNELLRWFVHQPTKLATIQPEPAVCDSIDSDEKLFESEAWHEVEQRLGWNYAFAAATRQPAKSSVSSLRRQAAAEEDETALITQFSRVNWTKQAAPRDGNLTAMSLAAADIGSAHHRFLQFVSLERTGSTDDLRLEAHRLEEEARLTAEQIDVLDFEGLRRFWGSELGARVSANAKWVKREVAFTARFTPGELTEVLGQAPPVALEDEMVLVQGIADLVVLGPSELWLVDFKTDRLTADELAPRVEEYEPQLRLYALALSRVYKRPVSGAWLYFLGLGAAVTVGVERSMAKL